MATLKKLREASRLRLDDAVAPFLWTDTELNDYINEAVAEAAVRSNLIQDRVSPVTKLAFTAGQSSAKISPVIHQVLRVYINGKLLKTIPEDDLPDNWENERGSPRGYFLEDQRNLWLYPAPATAITVDLVVYRSPREPMTQGNDEPEIPAFHHENLIDWVMHRAYQKRDSDTEDATLSSRHEKLFTRSFGPRLTADQMRRRHAGRRNTTRMNPSW